MACRPYAARDIGVKGRGDWLQIANFSLHGPHLKDQSVEREVLLRVHHSASQLCLTGIARYALEQFPTRKIRLRRAY